MKTRYRNTTKKERRGIKGRRVKKTQKEKERREIKGRRVKKTHKEKERREREMG